MSNSITIEFTERDDGSVTAEDRDSGTTADGSNRMLASVGLVSKLYGPEGLSDVSADAESTGGFLASLSQGAASGSSTAVVSADSATDGDANRNVDSGSMRGFLADETEKSACELVTQARAEDETRTRELQNRE